MLYKFARFVLFGNYYLAICIVALSLETAVKNDFLITGWAYYLLVFFSVVVYYTYAYTGDTTSFLTSNPRAVWYRNNRLLIRFTQALFTAVVVCLCVYFFFQYRASFHYLTLFNWVLTALFPFIALLYYGVIFPAQFRFRLRNIAWLKPFIIGFVCTGSIVIYPMLFHSLQRQHPFHISIVNSCYFLTNWLFTTVIAIMFDIKDFAADHNYRLQTFVVTKGLRRTIFYILLPLATASYLSFLVFAFIRHFSLLQLIINTLPFLLLFIAAASLRRRKGILYYLVVIDGLLLVKALFGIAAMMLV